MVTTEPNTQEINSPSARNRVLSFYLKRMYGRAARLVRDLPQNSPTEVVNIAGAEVFSRQKDFENREQFEAIFWTLMRWRAGDLRRKQDRRDAHVEQLVREIEHHCSPAEFLMAEELAYQVRRLPTRQQDAVVLRSLDLSIDEIATILAVSRRTVNSDLQLARDTLEAYVNPSEE